MDFYCFHCDQIIPSSEMIGARHKKCLNWPHPMTLHPAYEKDAKASLPASISEFQSRYPTPDECPDCGKLQCETNH